MTENELQNRLMQLTNVIPEATHQVYTAAALSGKREVVMKKKISAVLVFAIILVSITIVACAASIDGTHITEQRYRGTITLQQ